MVLGQRNPQSRCLFLVWKSGQKEKAPGSLECRGVQLLQLDLGEVKSIILGFFVGNAAGFGGVGGSAGLRGGRAGEVHHQVGDFSPSYSLTECCFDPRVWTFKGLVGHWSAPTQACVLQTCWVSLGAENQGLVGNPLEDSLFCLNDSAGLNGGERKCCEVVLYPPPAGMKIVEPLDGWGWKASWLNFPFLLVFFLEWVGIIIGHGRLYGDGRKSCQIVLLHPVSAKS